jgi:cytochrome c peroxidase
MEGVLMIRILSLALLLAGWSLCVYADPPLGLPPVPIPVDNPQTPEKIVLGDKLFHDTRFSADGKVSCSTCHDASKAFTDNLRVSKGVNGLTGTRNAPTVINSAYMKTQFWDGREPDLEGQSKQPPVNPVEGGLPDHTPILEVIRGDPNYVSAFKAVFGIEAGAISMDHVSRAIASFERTVVAGDSPFDRYYFGGDETAMNEAQVRGLKLFTGKARCVSCHIIEQTQALFTDNRFHNIGVGFKRIRGKEQATAEAFLRSKRQGVEVDVAVLTSENISELGRFAVTENITEVGAFKTSTLRNIKQTAPYMHDGSLKTLKDVVNFYNKGGRNKDEDPLSGFLSGGMRPLDLRAREKQDLVEFMEALTSPQLDQFTQR